MSSLKISQLTPSTAQSGDVIPIERADVNFSITAGSIAALASATPGGVTGDIQFNNGGVFGGSGGLFTFTPSTEEVFLDNLVSGAGTGPAFAIGTPQGLPNFGGGLMLTGNLAIGFAAELELHNPYAVGIEVFVHSNTSFRAPAINMQRSRGTQATPLAVQLGDFLDFINVKGHDGSAYATGAAHSCQANTAWTPSSHAAYFAASCTPIGSTVIQEVFRFGAQSTGTDFCNISEINLAISGVAVLEWGNSSGGNQNKDTGLSRIGSASLALGNSTLGDFSGSLKLTGLSVQGALTDGSASVGISGQVLSSTVTGVKWVSGLSWATLTGDLTETQVIPWDGPTVGTPDTGISRIGVASLAIGNGTAGGATGNLSYNRVNLAGADHAGTVTITAAATTQAVSYAANYTGTAAPVVVATPTSDPLALGVPVGYWVTPTGGAGAWTGFTMNIQTALAGNVTFNYIVIGKA